MSPRNRRHLLQSLAGMGTLVLAGCSSDGDPTTETPPPQTRTATETLIPTETHTEEPTPTETPTQTEPPTETATPYPSRRYQFGEWHDMDEWRITISEMELLTSFVTDDGEQYDMPDDEQLLIATVTVENLEYDHSLFADRFMALTGEQAYKDRPAFLHPELDSVSFRDLEQVDHQRQFGHKGVHIEVGERDDYWAVFVIPREIERSDLEIASNAGERDGYPIRWIPDE